MNNKNICMIGAGGHCRAVLDVIDSIKTYSISFGGYIKIARVIEDSRYLKKEDWDELCALYSHFFIAVGQIKDPKPRAAIANEILKRDGKLVTLISPCAYVSQRAHVEEGTIIMHKAVVNTNARIGRNCIINTGAIVEHDAKVGDYCHISTGAVVNGGASVFDCCFIGSNAVVLNQVVIGSGVVLGAGAVAKFSITEPGIYVGDPAGKIKSE